jgi:hypothetical protein
MTVWDDTVILGEVIGCGGGPEDPSVSREFHLPDSWNRVAPHSKPARNRTLLFTNAA